MTFPRGMTSLSNKKTSFWNCFWKYCWSIKPTTIGFMLPEWKLAPQAPAQRTARCPESSARQGLAGEGEAWGPAIPCSGAGCSEKQGATLGVKMV